MVSCGANQQSNPYIIIYKTQEFRSKNKNQVILYARKSQKVEKPKIIIIIIKSQKNQNNNDNNNNNKITEGRKTKKNNNNKITEGRIQI